MSQVNLAISAVRSPAFTESKTIKRFAKRMPRVALAAVKGDRTIAQLAEQFDVHPNQITALKAQLEGGASGVFGPGSAAPAVPAIDVKSLHAKIGELTLENDS